MSVLSGMALYFIFWWLTLFAVLPFGLRTQSEEGDVVNGTVSSAPANFKMKRVVVRTTIVSSIVFGAYLFITQYLGFTFDDFPRMIPDRGPTK